MVDDRVRVPMGVQVLLCHNMPVDEIEVVELARKVATVGATNEH
jgi:hypothetical protein